MQDECKEEGCTVNSSYDGENMVCVPDLLARVSDEVDAPLCLTFECRNLPLYCLLEYLRDPLVEAAWEGP